MSYLGVPPFGQTVRTITESLATAGQTTFSPSGGYLPGYIDVFLNGSALGAADFTATNGSTVVLNVAAALNDEFKAIAYWPVSLIDTYRKAEADALLAARVGTTSSVSMRNRIINGDMRIDQRNAGAAVTPTGASQYTIDRFIGVNTQSAKLTYQQVVDAPIGFVNSFKILVASAATPTAGDQFRFGQSIEGFNTADFGWGTANAQAATISFRAKASIAGIYSVALWNAANGRSYVTTVSLTTAWATYSFTVPGDTTGTWGTGNGAGIELIFDLGGGSNWIAPSNNAWQAGNYFKASGSVSLVSNAAATLNVTGVQLEAGTVATPFERRDYGRELMMCQRYCQVLRRTQTGAISDLIGVGVWSGNTDVDVVYPCVVTMRATPSVTFSGTTGFEFLRSAVAWQPVTSWISPEPTASAVRIIGTVATGDTRGFVAELRNLGTNTITISAEL